MANVLGIDLNIDEKFIQESVQSVVKAAMIDALGDPSVLVKAAIDQAINKYVDKKTGEESRKGNWGSVPWLDYLANKVVEDTVREVVVQVVEENTEVFKEEIKKQFSDKKFRNNAAAAFIRTIMDAATSRYSMPISISFKEDE